MKTFTILALTLFLGISARAQEFNQKGAHIGAAVGFNTIGIVNQNSYYTPELEYRATFGFNGGLVAGYNFTSELGLQVEAYYSKQGQKYADELVGKPAVTRSVESSYLQFPIMLKYMSGISDVQFYVMAGPQFGILTSSSVYGNGKEWFPNSILVPVQKKNFFQDYDCGVKLSTGADLKLNRNFYLNTGLSFYAGLTDINIPQLRRNGSEFQTKIYKASTNGYAGVNVGLHYMIGR